MIVWVARLASGLSALLGAVMAVNAVVAGIWQFWAGVVAFGLWAICWWMLGVHWAETGDGSRVVLDARTAVIAGLMVLVFIACGLVLSTMG